MDEEFLPQYEIFIKKANADLKAAEIILGAKDEGIDLEIIFFHLQQSAELKADTQ